MSNPLENIKEALESGCPAQYVNDKKREPVQLKIESLCLAPTGHYLPTEDLEEKQQAIHQDMLDQGFHFAYAYPLGLSIPTPSIHPIGQRTMSPQQYILLGLSLGVAATLLCVCLLRYLDGNQEQERLTILRDILRKLDP